MGKAVIAIIVILVLLLAFGGMYIGAKNQMVAKNETIKSNWAQIDNVLQRRADLIPNLVETVKGIAQQEKDVFGAIANARAAMMGARSPQERIAANQQIESALGRLFVIVENYPQLKSNENFLRLQDELAGTENRIAVERKRYNDSIQDYNTFIGQFPNSFFAGIAGFARNDAYFEAAPESRTVPKVNFGTGPAPSGSSAPAEPAKK